MVALNYHKSLRSIIDDFRLQIAATGFLIANIDQANQYFSKDKDILNLPCSVLVNNKIPDVMVDRNILNVVCSKGQDHNPMFREALINLLRIFTIAIKEIIWEDQDFINLKNKSELQFLRHLRNACAHNNIFFGGVNKKERQNTNNKMPIKWREKEINEDLENTSLYFDFLKPGDIFILLSDISNLVICSK